MDSALKLLLYYLYLPLHLRVTKNGNPRKNCRRYSFFNGRSTKGTRMPLLPTMVSLAAGVPTVQTGPVSGRGPMVFGYAPPGIRDYFDAFSGWFASALCFASDTLMAGVQHICSLLEPNWRWLSQLGAFAVDPFGIIGLRQILVNVWGVRGLFT